MLPDLARASNRPTSALMSIPDRNILEWHRVSVLGRVAVLWAIAVCFIFAGMVGTGLHLFAPPSLHPDARWLAGLLGWPSAVLGPVVGIVGIVRVLAGEQRALVVCRQELRFEGFGTIAPVAWRDLSSLEVVGRWPRRRLRVLAQRGDHTESIDLPGAWIGLSPRRLCARIMEIRRRALLGVVDRLP